MSNKNKILVGQFSEPVGLIGGIKINIMTSTFEVFKSLKKYSNFDESIVWNFRKITFKSNKCIAHLENFSSRDDVSKLKGLKIYSDKKNLPSTKHNEYYVNDLIGCKLIIKESNNIGKVIDIKNFGAGDLLEAKLNNKTVFIPFNKENIVSVSLSNKEVVIDPIAGILD